MRAGARYAHVVPLSVAAVQRYFLDASITYFDVVAVIRDQFNESRCIIAPMNPRLRAVRSTYGVRNAQEKDEAAGGRSGAGARCAGNHVVMDGNASRCHHRSDSGVAARKKFNLSNAVQERAAFRRYHGV